MNSLNRLQASVRAMVITAAMTVSPWVVAADLPATSAGKVLGARLEAFGSGSAEHLTQYKANHEPGLNIDQEMAFYRDTGGFDLLKVESSQEHAITAVIRAKDSDSIGRIELKVDPQNPERVAGLRMFPTTDVPPEFMPARLSLAEVLDGVQAKADAMAARDQYAGILLIVRGERVLLSRSWGKADRDSGLANSAETPFRIASMFKMFTAVAVLQLVEAGKLELDGKLAEYLPDYPNQKLASQVSIRQLLNHTGGTGDIFTAEYTARQSQIREHADYLALFGERAPEFAPGTTSGYSNYGYVVLGAVIEKVCDQSYYDYVQAKVFAPAGMTATGALPEIEVNGKVARGYTFDGKQLQSNRDSLPWRGTAAGGGYATTGDLLRFVQALQSEQLLSHAILEQALQPQNDDGWYGYGFTVGGQGALRWFGHDGGAEGMSGSLRVYPESGYVLISLANVDPPASERLIEYFANRMPL